jgi:hypothetical protein
LLTAKNSKILGIGILLLPVLPDIPTTEAEAATTNLGMSFGSPLTIFLFDFLIQYDAINVMKSSKDCIPPRVDSYLFISHIPVQHFCIIVINKQSIIPLALTSK